MEGAGYLHGLCHVLHHTLGSHTAAAGRPLWAGLFWFHTETTQENYTLQTIDFCKIHETEDPILPVCKNEWRALTLLPPTVWYFFSIAFFTGASSLYVMNTNPLLFSVFGSCGSSMVSIYAEGKKHFKTHRYLFVTTSTNNDDDDDLSYLSKCAKVLLDDFLRGVWVKASHKDFLDWILLHC